MAFDAFLELEKGGQPAVTGETLDAQFKAKKAMEIISFKLNSQRDMSDGEASEALGDDSNLVVLTVSKEVDNATPDLFIAYCKHASSRAASYDTMRLTVRKAAGSQQFSYLILEFTDVYIKSWKLESQDADELPEEKIDFAFETIKYQYYVQKATGGSGSMKESSWDFGAAAVQ